MRGIERGRARVCGLACVLVTLGAGLPAQAACPGETQLEMNQCAARSYQAADATLNAVWPQAKAAMDRLGAGQLLLDAQRKWIAYRDAACAAEQAQFEGGSIAPLIYFICMQRLTERRTEDLRALIN